MSEPKDSIAIRARGLERTFGSRKALRDMSFTLESGASLVVFGPNGAGKTTLLRLLALLDRPSSGELEINGTDACEDPDAARAHVGFISHLPMLYLDMSAFDNLEFFARLYGVENPKARADELLEMMELAHRKTDAVRGFSRGMLQRVSIARALVCNPDILLLDEPYTGLDAHASGIIATLLESRHGEMTTVTVSHDLRRGYDSATHLLVMDHGKKVLWGKRSDVTFDELQQIWHEQLDGR